MEPISFRPNGPAGVGEQTAGASGARQTGKGAGFTDAVKRVVSSVNDIQVEADESIEKLLAGKVTNVHEVVNAVAKADISFKMLIELRNKLIEAYKQTMNMQI